MQLLLHYRDLGGEGTKIKWISACKAFTIQPLKTEAMNSNSPKKQNPAAHKSEKDPAKPATNNATQSQQIADALVLLKPLTDFHASREDAGNDDVRIYWDVRLVRGKKEPLCHVHWTSSLPALLHYKMIARASTEIEMEVMKKITAPLVAALQAEAEKQVFANLRSPKPNPEVTQDLEASVKAAEEEFNKQFVAE